MDTSGGVRRKAELMDIISLGLMAVAIVAVLIYKSKDMGNGVH